MIKNYIFLTFLILVLAALPRGVELFAHNYLWGFDQGLFFMAVKAIVVDHKFTLIGAPVGGQGGFFQGAGWYYLLAIPFFLTNGNPYGAMIMMFLIGMVTVFLAIYVAQNMFSWKEGLLIGLFIAVSPNIIPQSRFIWPPFPISLLTVLFLYFFFKVLEGGKKYIALVALCFGLMTHFEVATAASFFAEFLLFTPVLLLKKLLSWRSIILSAIVLVFTQTPLLLFDMRHQFLITKGILHLRSSTANPHHQVIQKYFEAMFMNHYGVFASSFASMFPFLEHFWFLIAILLLIGSFVYIKDNKNSFAKKFFVFYLAISPFALFAVFFLYLWPMWNWWILQLSIFYLFLSGILLVYFYQKKIFQPVFWIILAFFLFSYIGYTKHAYTGDLRDYGGTAKIQGKLDAIDYIYQDAKGKQFGLLVFTPPVYTYAYDYLVWWYGQRHYHYLPYQEKKGSFYLLIEPDNAKPWTYKGWLETVIKTGKVIETKTLPSGFIVQKRILSS